MLLPFGEGKKAKKREHHSKGETPDNLQKERKLKVFLFLQKIKNTNFFKSLSQTFCRWRVVEHPVILGAEME